MTITNIRTKQNKTPATYSAVAQYCHQHGVTDETTIFMTHQKINSILQTGSGEKDRNILQFK